MKILAKVAYKGTNYQGWQKQTNQLTIQDNIENVLSKILNTEAPITGSGRTDAGVHAKGQYFTFEVKKDVDLDRLRYSVNCLLPKDIHIISFKEVSDDFHARYSAKEKHYSYTIQTGENNPFTNELSYNYLGELDYPRLCIALNEFNGTHNFQDFTSKEEDLDNFIRTVRVETAKGGNMIRIDFYGPGFMRYMIRFMVGAAIAVAEKREKLEFISSHLQDDKNREIINYKAPSEGLILEDVMYENI